MVAMQNGWIRVIVQPVILLGCLASAMVGLGVAQRQGWLPAAGGSVPEGRAPADKTVRYVCPMMCMPPQSEPGRCAVCAMELVASADGPSSSDGPGLYIDPVARRVAHIRTAAVVAKPAVRTLTAVGELQYDEAEMKSISAYVGGRLERLYADYTGAEVHQGDPLVVLYSPELYTGQVELLLAKEALDGGRTTTHRGGPLAADRLYASACERLLELGMTQAQVDQLERSGQASSRMTVCAPISGTVIGKRAVEGEYVKEGDIIYKLADLSTVWLLLRLLPEDAALVGRGQEVHATLPSLPGRRFTGRVDFVDPQVDPGTRTVGVRVVMPNGDGALRVGDYATAELRVPVGDGPVVVIPADAVLTAGTHSVVYVETQVGYFEIRPVLLGPHCGEDLVVVDGLQPGEQVATSGNFLIDSQMQLAGRPSLIDPLKMEPPSAPPAGEMSIVHEESSVEGASSADADPLDLPPMGEMQPVEPPVAAGLTGDPAAVSSGALRQAMGRDPQASGEARR